MSLGSSVYARINSANGNILSPLYRIIILLVSVCFLTMHIRVMKAQRKLHREQPTNLYFSLNIHSYLNGCTALCWALTAFSISYSYTQSIGLLGRGISPSQGLYTGQHKHRINAHRYPCLGWDSNPQSQRSSERREFILYAARPL
jgi:hypothetical protein